MRIEIVDYQSSWPEEFNAAARQLRSALGPAEVTIHHIGSTSVPGLAAKDIIDIQVGVAELTPSVIAVMTEAGYAHRQGLVSDHMPPGADIALDELAKYVFAEPAGERRTNIHVRRVGTFNHRYAVLFRDYLRSNGDARDAYATVKKSLARLFPTDLDAYYSVKDPAIDMLMAGAEIWASASNWALPPSDA